MDRMQPMLPLRPGLPERQTHDYKRHGTIGMFVALDVATGQVTHDTRKRHAGADFLAFLKRIARAYPKGEIHLILDNVSTHKTPAVRAWLEKHPRFQFHFTPASASWTHVPHIAGSVWSELEGSVASLGVGLVAVGGDAE